MGWLKKDDRFPEHRKVRRLNDSQYRLHDTALHACAKDETDGHVTEDDIADMEHGERLRKHVPALVKARLWHEPGHECADCPPIKEGWQIHDYLKYNPSHEQQEDARAAARDRQARWRKGKKDDPTDGVSRRDTAVSDASLTRTSQLPVPSRPVPSRPDPLMGHLGMGGEPKQDDSERCPHGKPKGENCGGCADARRAEQSAVVAAEKAKNARDRLADAAARAQREAEARDALAADPDEVARAAAEAKQALRHAREAS